MDALKRLSPLVIIGAILCAPIVSCSKSQSPDEQTQAHDDPNIARYTVRGRIVQLPQEGIPTSQFSVHHEPIPSFVSGGHVVGMNEMTMPFPLAESVSLDGLFVDDIIELTFEVRMNPDTGLPDGYEATVIERLPPDTHLVFDSPLESQQASPDENP